MASLILGGQGQLGQALARLLGGAAVCLSRAHADLTQPRSLAQAFDQFRPDFVLNCAAYNHVDRAETEPEAAFAVNAFGVRHLTQVCRDRNATLVHFSTDYVFGLDEDRRTPYREEDVPGPINAYGASKLAGEAFARAISPKHFVIRTSALFGPGENNFVSKILRQARAGQPIRVVSDQTTSPTFVDDLAAATLRLVATRAYGLYHVTGSDPCTWHEFAQAICAAHALKPNLEAVTSDAFPAAARRPRFSVLANEAYSRLGLPPLPTWRQALERLR